MRNPFEDLFNRRRRNERRIKKAQLDQRQGAQLSGERTRNRLLIKQSYDALVTGLLEQFILAVDPKLKFYSHDFGWSVGRWESLSEDKSSRWHSILDVQLLFGINDAPLYFEVTRHRKKVRAGLGDEELAVVLRSLYSGMT